MNQQDEQQFLHDLEKKLWTSANKLLPSLDASQYKHVLLGLVFLKYVSDSFDLRRAEIRRDLQDIENQDYYLDPADFGGAADETTVEIVRGARRCAHGGGDFVVFRHGPNPHRGCDGDELFVARLCDVGGRVGVERSVAATAHGRRCDGVGRGDHHPAAGVSRN